MNDATTARPLPDTAETAVAELRRLSDLPIDDVATEPDPFVPGVWKVETPAWVAIVYLAGYGGRGETDFEAAPNETRDAE